MKKIDVSINGQGSRLRIKTEHDWFYQVTGSRVVYSEYKMLLRHLDQFDGTILFPFTGNSPIGPACFSQLNPNSKIKVYERDAHDFRAMNSSLKDFKNVEVILASDAEKESGNVMAVVTVLNNRDRLFSFDIIEKLNEILPDRSDVYMVIQRKRQKDFMKKLGKEFFGGNVIDKCREAILYKCKTNASKNKWSARQKVVEVDAIGAAIKMVTRPGVFAHGRVDTGGLALYESTEVQPGESVLEMGCGAGLAGLLLAQRQKEEYGENQSKFLLVDSDKRAVDCCLKNIELNDLKNIKCELTDLLETEDKFDVVIGNPPYYANHRIADYFIKTAYMFLKEGGRLYIVSKHPEQIAEIFDKYDFSVEHNSRRGYTVTVGKFD